MADDDVPDGTDNLEEFLRGILSEGEAGPATPTQDVERAPDVHFLPANSPLSSNIEDRRTTLNDDPNLPGRAVGSAPPPEAPRPWMPGVLSFADGGAVPDPDDGWAPVDQPVTAAVTLPSQDDGWAPVDQPAPQGATSQDDGWAPVDALPAPESAVATTVRNVAHGALPFAASLPAMGAGAELGGAAGLPLAPFTLGASVPIGAAIGAGIAGFATNWLASAAEDKIESMLGIDDSAQRQSNAQAHSTADMVGDIIPMVAGFKVGQLAGSAVSRGINAVGMGGVSAAQQLATTGKIDPVETAEQAALGALLNEPRSGSAKLMGMGASAAGRVVPGRPDLQGDQSAKDDAHVPPPPSGQPGVASDPVRPTQRTVGDETGSENQYPKDNATPTANGPMVSEGDIDPTLQSALSDPAIQSMAKPRPNQKPLEPPAETGLPAASQQRPPAAQAAIEGRPPEAAQQTQEPSADEATPATGEVPPSAQQASDPAQPSLPGVSIEKAELPAGYIARSDNAGTKVYKAPNVPDTLDVNGHTVPVDDALKVHEIFERRGIAMLQKAIAAGRHPPMSDAEIYATAHEKAGTAAERAYLEEHVGTPDKPFTEADFADYQRQMKDLSRDQKGGTPPADLYRFMDEPEAQLRLHTPAGQAGDDVTAAARTQREAEQAVHDKVRAGQGSEADADITGSINPDRPAAPQTAPEDVVTAAVKEPAGLKPILKLIAEHPTMSPEAKVELSTKLKTASPEVIAKAYEGLRPRQRAAVEGLGVTARTKGDAALKQGAIDAAKAAFDKHVPTSDVLPVGAAAARELHARLSAAVGEAGPKALTGFGSDKKSAYKPRAQPAATQWLLAADKLIKGKMTPKKMTEFTTLERQLRTGKAEDAAAAQSEKRVDADIAMSRRSGEEAIDHAQAAHVDPYAEENKMIEHLDRSSDAFDVPHEEGEEGRTPEPVSSREDLERLAAKPNEEPFDVSKMTPEELSALADRMAQAPESAGKQQWKIDEEARAAKTAALRALRLAKNGAKPLEPEVLKRARYEWSELQQERGARPTERKAEDMGAGDKILAHLDERYPDPGSWNTRGRRAPGFRERTPEEDYFASLHDRLAQITQRDTADLTAIRQHIDSFPPELRENPARLERIYRAHERGDLDSLDPQSRELYNKYLRPMFDQANTLFSNIKKIAPEKIGDKVLNHIMRIRKGYDPDLDVLQSGLSGDPIEGVQGVSGARKGAMNDRVFTALERKTDGKRLVISPDPDGKGYTKWQGGIGTHVDFPGFKHVEGADMSNHGIDYTMRDALTDEIEKNAKFADNKPARYYHNPILSAALGLKDLALQARHLQFLKATKEDPKFLASSTTSKKTADDRGWVTTKMPQFDGIYMDPNLARVFDQYAKPGFDMPDWLRSASQAVTKTLFWMPTAHILNVGMHWFGGRGWDWIKPTGYRNLAVSSVQAIRSVMAQDNRQLDLYRRNAGLRLGAVLNKDYLQVIGKIAGEQIEKQPEWVAVSKVLGVGVPELAKAVYAGSSRVMWAANDMFLTQQIIENEMKGMTKEMAISHAERHIPNYRIPATLVGSGKMGRFFAQWMEDPVTSSFGRYHYGVFNSYAHMVHDMIDKGATGKERLDAVGNLMALGFLAFAIKPAMDAMAQLVTGNKNAETHDRGPLAVPAQIGRVLKGQDDLMAPVRNMASMPPAVTTALEARDNKDFSGHAIVQPGDVELAAHGSAKAAGRALVAEGEHAVRGLISPVNTAANAFGKGQGPLAALRDQALDIKEPSQKSVKYDRTQPAKAEHTAITAKPRGPMAALYDKMFGRGR